VLRLKVKEVAEKKQVSMHKLSQQAQVSYNIVRKLFNNPYQIVNTDTLGRLVDALDCEVEEIIERVKDEKAGEDK
jgi:DNA-binding Xre family transcriptional regulator